MVWCGPCHTSFEQGVAVTPIQIATAFGAIAYEILLKPKVVRYLSYWDNKSIQAIPTTVQQRVVSSETANKFWIL